MAETETIERTPKLKAKTPNGGSTWNSRPALPVEMVPVFDWPPRPAAALKWFAQSWFTLTIRVIILLISIACWFYLQPPLEAAREFAVGWVAHLYLRNIGLMLLIAGGLHLYFWTYKKQGKDFKFEARDQAANNRVFTFNDQVWDNMFWSLGSGVAIWTAFEAVSLWAFANGYIAFLNWHDNPALFIALILLVPTWSGVHFYVIHRFLHWRPVYDSVHILHHRNVNVGPWSGMSMHPLEQVLYLSSCMIHWVVASHPIHVIFNLQFQTLNAVAAHSGFETLTIGGKRTLRLGNFFHQLHHKYYECNYGTREFPLDAWLGTFHDGTREAGRKMRDRLRKRAMGPA